MHVLTASSYSKIQGKVKINDDDDDDDNSVNVSKQ